MNDSNSRWLWLILGGCLLVLLLALLLPRPSDSGGGSAATPPAATRAVSGNSDESTSRRFVRRSALAPPPDVTAEEIVASKVQQFARSRREMVRAMAQRARIDVPDSVERFFDALDSGDWDEISARFEAINGGDSSASSGAPGRPTGIEPLWPAIIDAFGVAEQANLWPAQKLLDYGEAVLGSLRPGMVYIGGTDEGRWVPTLLNETSDGERHILITQNGLADRMYLDYVTFLYEDRFATLNEEDSNRAFHEYLLDAHKRLLHDQQFPDEPKQIRPGENVKNVDGRTEVSGHGAVFAVNEKLLQALLEKNPGLSFALQESYPLKSTYADAAPLGPIMELRAATENNALTAERAAESVDYWRQTAQELRGDPDASASSTAPASYSKLIVGQANLFAEHNLSAEAEQAYRIATEILPANIEAVTGLAHVLTRAGRAGEALQLLEDFARKHPNQRAAIDEVRMSRP